MDAKRIAEIGARVAATTPGTWSVPHFATPDARCECVHVLADGYCGSVCDISVDNGKAIGDGGNDAPPLEEAKANARFIAHAHDDVPALIAEVRRLQEKLGQARDRHADIVEHSYREFDGYGKDQRMDACRSTLAAIIRSDLG